MPPHKLALFRAKKPTVAFYRYLYNNVGADWLWWERRAWDDKKLKVVIEDEKLEIYVLYVDGVPAGYGELDRHNTSKIELAYFGLMPEFIGQKLGGYFLRWLIDLAWDYGPKRLFVQTCSLDHPAALYNYQRHGFKPYKQVSVEIDDPATSRLFD